MQVVGIGSLNVDRYYFLEDPQLLAESGWPVVPGGEVCLADEELPPLEAFLARRGRFLGQSSGGSAANTVFALARMGFAAGSIGVVGDDAEGEFVVRSLAPVDTRRIRVLPGRTGTALIVLDPGGERTIIVFPQANARLHAAGISAEEVRGAAFVHLSSFVNPRAKAAQEAVVAGLPAEVKVSLDPGEVYARQGLGALENLLRRSYIVFLTIKELELLLGTQDPGAARCLLEFGPEVVAVKMGASGSRIFTPNQELEVPALPVSPVDTTGAGDVYDAGFLAGLILGLPLPECARLASEAASISVTGRGRERYPDAVFLRNWLGKRGAV
jgi:ribokinase